MRRHTLSWLKRFSLELCLYLIVFIGIGMRLDYFGNRVFRTYHLDALSLRLAYIQEVSDNGMPRGYNPTDVKEAEAAEQPLYYLLAGKIVTRHKEPGFSVSVFRLGLFSTALSIGSLVFVLLTTFYVSSRLARCGMVIVSALAPFYLTHTCDIGDDNLVLFASTGFFYFVMRLNRAPLQAGLFWWALAFLAMALFSKISAVVLLLAIPWLLWRSTKNGAELAWVSNRLGMTSFVFVLWLFITLYRAWNHENKVLTYIDPLPLSFDHLVLTVTPATFTTTHLWQMIIDGHATLDPDSAKYSYLTTLYGRYFIGSWDYNILLFSPQSANRLIMLLGLMFPLGLLLAFARSIWKWRRSTFLNTTALGVIMVGFGLQMFLVYWFALSQCGDPVYLYPILPWLLFIGWRGLTTLSSRRYFIPLIWVMMFVLTIAFLVADLSILTSNCPPEKGL